MATFKHISSKNADYGAAEQYLTFEHDEFTMKPTLDKNGRLLPICTNLVRMLAFVTCPFFVFQQKNPQNTQERHPQKEG